MNSRTFCLKTFASASAAAARFAGLVSLKKIQRRFEGVGLAVDLEFEAGQRLVEEAAPGGGAGHGLFVEQLFEIVGELVGPLFPAGP